MLRPKWTEAEKYDGNNNVLVAYCYHEKFAKILLLPGGCYAGFFLEKRVTDDCRFQDEIKTEMNRHINLFTQKAFYPEKRRQLHAISS